MRRAHRVVALVVAVMVAALLPSCAVSAEDEPRTIADRVDDAFVPVPEVTSGDGTSEVVVWLVRDARLEPVIRDVAAPPSSPIDALEAALSELFAGPRAAEAAQGLRSAVPPDTELGRISVLGEVATIEVSQEIARIGGADEVRAVAQIVLTVTEFPSVRRVRLSVDGELLQLPLPGGELSPRPVSADAYDALVSG